MTAEAQEMLNQVLSLPHAERRCIAQILFDSLPPEPASEIELEWLEEAQKRAGKLERGDVEARDGHRVISELEAKFRNLSSRDPVQNSR